MTCKKELDKEAYLRRERQEYYARDERIDLNWKVVLTLLWVAYCAAGAYTLLS